MHLPSGHETGCLESVNSYSLVGLSEFVQPLLEWHPPLYINKSELQCRILSIHAYLAREVFVWHLSVHKSGTAFRVVNE